jgi:PTS system glucose-specific IIC component
MTRLRVKVRDVTLVDETALKAAGVAGIMRLEGGVVHIIIGAAADEYAMAVAGALR